MPYRGAASAYRAATASRRLGRSLRRIERALQRLQEEALDARGSEGEDHAHGLVTVVVEAVDGAARHVHEVPGAGRHPLVSEANRAPALDNVERLVLVAVDMWRRASTGRDDRLHREVRAAGLLTGDEEPVEVAGTPVHVAGALRPMQQPAGSRSRTCVVTCRSLGRVVADATMRDGRVPAPGAAREAACARPLVRLAVPRAAPVQDRLERLGVDDVRGRRPAAARGGDRERHVPEPGYRVRVGRAHDLARRPASAARTCSPLRSSRSGRPLTSSATPSSSATRRRGRGRARSPGGG